MQRVEVNVNLLLAFNACCYFVLIHAILCIGCLLGFYPAGLGTLEACCLGLAPLLTLYLSLSLYICNRTPLHIIKKYRSMFMLYYLPGIILEDFANTC